MYPLESTSGNPKCKRSVEMYEPPLSSLFTTALRQQNRGYCKNHSAVVNFWRQMIDYPLRIILAFWWYFVVFARIDTRPRKGTEMHVT